LLLLGLEACEFYQLRTWGAIIHDATASNGKTQHSDSHYLNWFVSQSALGLCLSRGRLPITTFACVGDLYEVDLHLQVDTEIPVEAGHAIARAVKRSMRKKHPVVSKVLVHVEPANREHIMNRGLSGSGDADIKISNH
jgi:hypothetical protein